MNTLSHPIGEILSHFDIEGEFVSAYAWEVGHINDTFIATFSRPGKDDLKVVLQRINHHVFPDPPLLMENYRRVTEHLKTKVPDPRRNALQLFHACNGKPYYHAPDGTYWRVTRLVEHTFVVSVIDDCVEAHSAARAFARFQTQLADLPEPRLHETIVGFHHTPGRMEAFKDAVSRDACKRAKHCRDEVEFALAREDMVAVVSDALEHGEIPERITHNDTKINNVLFDSDTHEAVCIVDLDTVMPGSALYDFGDMVRSSAGAFDENERDLSKVELMLDRFEALVRGYTEGAEFLCPRECELLAFSGRLLTFETGLRFLTDFLQGDNYFRIDRETENLDRCRTQFKFVEEMERHRQAMEAIVRKHCPY